MRVMKEEEMILIQKFTKPTIVLFSDHQLSPCPDYSGGRGEQDKVRTTLE